MSLTLVRREPPTDPARHTGEACALSAKVENLVNDAYAVGRKHGYEVGAEHGEQQHYMAGWRWGLICGLLAGLLSGGAAVALISHYF